MLKILCWNINRSSDAWKAVLDSEHDIALLQEAAPPESHGLHAEVNPGEWRTAGALNRQWRTAIVKLSDDVEVEWLATTPIHEAGRGDFAVSRAGTLSAARVTKEGMEPVVLISCYAPWENHHTSESSGEIYSDASAHRLISDLSCFVSTATRHRIIAAGDFNVLYGYGEGGSPYWKARFSSVFERFKSLGFVLSGPQFPHGRQASPWPKELPQGSMNVPTYYTSKQSPLGATRQLDFVFASRGISDKLTVTARNTADQWGPSDHCCIDITLDL